MLGRMRWLFDIHGNDVVDMLCAVVEGLKMSDAFGKSLFSGRPLCHMLCAVC